MYFFMFIFSLYYVLDIIAQHIAQKNTDNFIFKSKDCISLLGVFIYIYVDIRIIFWGYLFVLSLLFWQYGE